MTDILIAFMAFIVCNYCVGVIVGLHSLLERPHLQDRFSLFIIFAWPYALFVYWQLKRKRGEK